MAENPGQPPENWFDWDDSKPAEDAGVPAMQAETLPVLAPESAPESAPEPPGFPEAPLEPAPDSLAEASESVPASAPAPLPAERPFTLLIEGTFTSEDREKLLELLSRENFGIREVDLEPQWEAGRLLLPQISEYAAMRVAQVLREGNLELKLEPAGSGASSLESSSEPFRTWQPGSPIHPAEQIPVTSLDHLGPGHSADDWEAIDTLLATGRLMEPEWKASQTDAFSRLVEALKRELRYRAHIRRAEALIRFKAEILSGPWQESQECRVQVSALAIRKSPLPSA
jgi:hypothetical protein